MQFRLSWTRKANQKKKNYLNYDENVVFKEAVLVDGVFDLELKPL